MVGSILKYYFIINYKHIHVLLYEYLKISPLIKVGKLHALPLSPLTIFPLILFEIRTYQLPPLRTKKRVMSTPNSKPNLQITTLVTSIYIFVGIDENKCTNFVTIGRGKTTRMRHLHIRMEQKWKLINDQNPNTSGNIFQWPLGNLRRPYLASHKNGLH